jgi:hypothetical protein
MFHINDNLRSETTILVNIYYMGISMGMFHAKNIKFYGLLLKQGPVTFPVGSDINIEFYGRDGTPRFCMDATVVRLVSDGMKVVFNAVFDPIKQMNKPGTVDKEKL